MITIFDKTTCAQIAKRLVELVKPLEQEFGITAQYAGGTFDVSGGEFTAKVKMSVSQGAELTWKQYAGQLGLKPEDFGREFTALGKTYRICGIYLKRKKPVAAEQISLGPGKGKRFVFEDAFIRLLFGVQYEGERLLGGRTESPERRER